MSRSIEQILAEQRIELSPRLVRTPDTTISIGEAWIVSEFHWNNRWLRYIDGPSPLAITILVASVWLLAVPIPPEMPWLIPVCFAAFTGALWSIALWLINRLRTNPQPELPSRGLTFSVAGSESAVTIFQSDDEQEVKLVRQKLEATLLPNG